MLCARLIATTTTTTARFRMRGGRSQASFAHHVLPTAFGFSIDDENVVLADVVVSVQLLGGQHAERQRISRAVVDFA